MKAFKFEHFLMVIVGVLFCVSTFVIGWGLGGGKEPEVANKINGIIAFASMTSGIGALLSFYFLVLIRNDWKAPKTSDAALDFLMSLKRWQRDAQALHWTLIQPFAPTPSEIAKLIEFDANNEVVSWLQLEQCYDKYSFFSTAEVERDKLFNELLAMRRELVLASIRCKQGICESTIDPADLGLKSNVFFQEKVEELSSYVRKRN